MATQLTKEELDKILASVSIKTAATTAVEETVVEEPALDLPVDAGIQADVAEFERVRTEIDQMLTRQRFLVNRIHSATSWRETGRLLGMKESSARYLGGNGSRVRKHTYSSQRGKL